MKWTNSLKKTQSAKTYAKVDNLIKPISFKEIESVIRNLSKQKAPGRNGFTGELY